MRVLFFSNIPIRTENKGGYNGGGWIISLIKCFSKHSNDKPAMAFFGETDEKIENSELVVYQIAKNNLIKKIKREISFFTPFADAVEKKSWRFYETKLQSVINDFKPDIIHIFGSELQFGLIANQINVPTVLHIQGLLNPYLNAFLPPFFSWGIYRVNPLMYLKAYRQRKIWETSCLREKEIILRNQNYLGRTTWDRRVTKILNPQRRYFYCGEILREEFYKSRTRVFPKQLTIVSTISSPLYKGYDVILKTADLLKKTYKCDFIWKVFGNISPFIIEKNLGIRGDDVNVVLTGVASAETLISAISTSTVFVHLSYIDNSPNSVCEAQLLGVPVIAANVGGLASIVDNEKNGYLVPANDPYQTAFLIWQLYCDEQLNKEMGDSARAIAEKRHNPETIVIELCDVYKKIMDK